MKNFFALIVILVCLGLIIFGILEKNKSVTEPELKQALVPEELEVKKEELVAQQITDSEVIKNNFVVNNETELARFYPDSTIGDLSQEVFETDGRNFQLTPELEARFYLIDKYNPGVCYGTASAPPEISLKTVLSAQQLLAEYISQNYNLSSDLDVYNKIKQLNGVNLKEISSSNYDYSFVDGQCAILTYHEGKISVINGRVEEFLASRDTYNINDLKIKK
jgi:hypothetical protein